MFQQKTCIFLFHPIGDDDDDRQNCEKNILRENK